MVTTRKKPRARWPEVVAPAQLGSAMPFAMPLMKTPASRAYEDTMRIRSVFGLVLALTGLALALSVVGCGDDDSDDESVAGTGGATAGSGGSIAGSGASTGGELGTGGRSPVENIPQVCRPERHRDDPCLACLTRRCCSELQRAGGQDENRYAAYPELQCMVSCFESAEDAGADDDAGADGSALGKLIDCAPQCYPVDYFDYRARDLLACTVGGPRPVPLGGDAWVEGEADDDAGVVSTCAAECFPSWP